MGYVSLSYLKKQLNIDSAFTDDDEYIQLLEEAAEEVVARYCDYPLSQYEDENGNLPKSLNHAIALWVATNYSIRESVSATSMNNVPGTFELLMDLFRDYRINKDE